ncbi:MAG TPA: hypothetical protein VGJ01_10200, partial [Pseudolabrys sp.]
RAGASDGKPPMLAGSFSISGAVEQPARRKASPAAPMTDRRDARSILVRTPGKSTGEPAE